MKTKARLVSDNWITLVPEDPYFVPDMARASALVQLFKSIAPDADHVVAQQAELPQLMDAGVNLEAIICTECLKELDPDWWVATVQADQIEGGFALKPHATPCCGAKVTLNDLAYHMPQAFGVFAIEAMNPSINKLTDGFIETAEATLGTPLTVVYCHI